jgi:hypothetical protein
MLVPYLTAASFWLANSGLGLNNHELLIQKQFFYEIPEDNFKAMMILMEKLISEFFLTEELLSSRPSKKRGASRPPSE